MLLTWLRNVVRGKPSSPGRCRDTRRLCRFRPELEVLEYRFAPAVHTWTGGASNLWSNNANWSESSPAGDAAAELRFPGGAAFLDTVNDLVALTVEQIDFTGGGYKLSGNALNVISPVLESPFIVSSAGTNEINMPLTLASSGATSGRITIDAGTLQLNGVIGGSTGLDKVGLGRLGLSGSNTFTGPFHVLQGAVLVQNGSAFGSEDAGRTNVSAGAAVEVQGGINVPETINLAGFGIDGAGALRSTAGTNTWTGFIVLVADASIGVDAGTLSVSGEIGNVGATSTFGLNKVGAGTLVLTTDNPDFRGTVVVDQGVLNIQHAGALGSTTAGTTLAAGASLQLQGGISVAENLNLSGIGITGKGALRSVGGSNTWTGPIFLGTNSYIGVDADALTIAGVISSVADTTFGFSKAGAGKLTLTSDNPQLRGEVGLIEGVLNIQHAGALGTTTAGTSVAPLGTLELQGGISVTGETLLLFAFSPVTETLRSVAGSNTWTGSVGLIPRLAADGPGTVGIGVNNGSLLTISGVIGGLTSSIGPAGLQKRGTGKLILTAANTYQGNANVVQGVMNIRNNSALGSGSNGTTVLAGAALELEGSVNVTASEGLVLSGTGISGAGALRSISGINSWAGLVNFGDFAGGASIGVDPGSTLTLSGTIFGGTSDPLTKVGGGTLIVTGSSPSYTGQTNVSDGRLLVNGSLVGSPVVVAGGTLGGTGMVGPVTGTSGAVSPGVSPGILSTSGEVVLGEMKFQVELLGTRPGSGHDQLNVTGAVTLTNATLQVLSLDTQLATGSSFRILNNDGTDAVKGTFAGLAEGAIITMSTGQLLQISYKAGDGNDVVLTRVNAPSKFPNRAVTSPIDEGDKAVLTGTINEPDARDLFILEVNWGDGTTKKYTLGPGRSRDVNLSHIYKESGTYTISLVWHDQDGAGNSGEFTVVVN